MIRFIPHYTWADYAQWPGDWELWNGIPVAMTPSPFGLHQFVAANLIREFSTSVRQARIGLHVLHEIDWIVSDDTVVRPDIVVCDGVPREHLTQPPRIVVEVLSPSTAEKDRTVKFELCQQQSVPYYLIVDPDQRTIQVFRLDAAGRYAVVPFTAALRFEIPEYRPFDVALEQAFT